MSDSGDGGRSSDLVGLTSFMRKTYDMVDDLLTDDTVSWVPDSDTNFIIRTPLEFSNHVLPKYFQHNNFSRFISQLDTHGFRKVDQDRWEFSNEGFVRSQRPSGCPSHSQQEQYYEQQQQARTALVEACNTGMEEIFKLKSEKNILIQQNMKLTLNQQLTNTHIMELNQKINDMQQCRQQIMAFLDKAMQAPDSIRKIAGNKDDSGKCCKVFDKKAKKRRIARMKEEADGCKNMFHGQREMYTPDVVKNALNAMAQLLEIEASSYAMETGNGATTTTSSSSSSYSSDFNYIVGACSKKITSCASSTTARKHLVDTAISPYNPPPILEDDHVCAQAAAAAGDEVGASSTAVPLQEPSHLDYFDMLLPNENGTFWSDVRVGNLMSSLSEGEENENQEDNPNINNITDKMSLLS